jgi:hypothetical protein
LADVCCQLLCVEVCIVGDGGEWSISEVDVMGWCL